MTAPSRFADRAYWLLLLTAIFACVVGARFWCIQKYGCAMPFWDQWDAEGLYLLKPWIEGHYRLGALFLAHNEHRVVFTRLITLGLFELNGQWDNQLESAFNALLCGAIAVATTLIFWRTLGPPWRWVVAVAITLLFCLPQGWENTLWGFQSQFSLLEFFSLGVLWGIGANPPGAWPRKVGVIGAALTPFTMASGFVAVTLALAWDVLRQWRRRTRPDPGQVLTWGVCAAVICFGLWSHLANPGLAELKARSAGEFFEAFGRALAWPYCRAPLAGLILWLPLATLCVGLARAKRFRTPIELIVLTGLLVAAQAAAIGWARGVHGGLPASRYQDLLALGAVANLFALLAVIGEPVASANKHALQVAAGIGWILFLIVGLMQVTASALRFDMPGRRELLMAGERALRRYVTAHDPQILQSRSRDLPYPDPAKLTSMLDDSTLRAILPADVREPLTIIRKDDAALDPGFIPNGFPKTLGASSFPTMTWGSFDAAGLAGRGDFKGTFQKIAGLPYLRFDFSGLLGEADVSFVLRDPVSGWALDHHPGSVPHNHWRTDYLLAPPRNLEIIALDRSPTRWFAFGGAAEVGWWSYWAGCALRRGEYLFGAGLSLLGLLPLGRWLGRWSRRAL